MPETKLPRSVQQFLAEAGRKGGSVTSEAKTEAARTNAKLPRPNRSKKKTKSRKP